MFYSYICASLFMLYILLKNCYIFCVIYFMGSVVGRWLYLLASLVRAPERTELQPTAVGQRDHVHLVNHGHGRGTD